MIDLKLVSEYNAEDYHDLKFENYDLVLTDGLDQIAQNLHTRMQFFFEEWILDITKGIKFYDFVFIKNPDLNTIAAIMKAYISDTPQILEILEYSQEYDEQLRKLTITYKVQATLGVIDDTVPIGV